jgi:transposase InsO family protein
MVAFVDQHRDAYGVESICRLLPIAPSTYFRRRAQHANPSQRSARAQRDEVLKAIIRRLWTEHHQVYGARKVWKQMGREGLRVARCRVRRLMRELGLTGAVRGRAWVTTTQSGPATDLPHDLVHRQFTATRPDQLWVADFTFVATWRGFVYVAFVVDVFSRRIVGWRAAASMRTDLVLDALEHAIYDRCDDDTGDLVHHSDRGSQLGLKGPSQRVCASLSLDDVEVLLQASSSRGSFVADC